MLKSKINSAEVPKERSVWTLYQNPWPWGKP
jgi:hypothetical protein